MKTWSLLNWHSPSKTARAAENYQKCQDTTGPQVFFFFLTDAVLWFQTPVILVNKDRTGRGTRSIKSPSATFSLSWVWSSSIWTACMAYFSLSLRHVLQQVLEHLQSPLQYMPHSCCREWRSLIMLLYNSISGACKAHFHSEQTVSLGEMMKLHWNGRQRSVWLLWQGPQLWLCDVPRGL